MLVLSFGSKVRPRTFGCVYMGSAVLFILCSMLIWFTSMVENINVVTVLAVWDGCLCWITADFFQALAV